MMMKMDIVFDDLQTPCWRHRDEEFDTEILEQRAAEPDMQSPEPAPKESPEKESEPPTESDNQKYEFGLSIFGADPEKPISQILSQNDQEREEDFTAKIYAIHSRSSTESHLSHRMPTRLAEINQPEPSKPEQPPAPSNVSMTLLTTEMKQQEAKSLRNRGPQIMKTAIEIAPKDQKELRSKIKVHDERV